ncbi:MAG: 2-dehydro-3-deoxygalactonokinase [Pseudomonadota bacterium]
MTFAGPLLAVDWGTTNRRVYQVGPGGFATLEHADKGVTSIADFPAEIVGIRDRFGDLPILMAGMVGSTIGWRLASYVAAPANVADIASHLLHIDDRTAIVPGVSTTDSPDVMRGEEVQLLGAVAAGLAPENALLVQPGTHSKWVDMEGGRIARFTTAMTGELFALLRQHGILASQLSGEARVDNAFRDGLAEGAKRDLAASLFGIRAAKLLGVRDDADAASFASGLLIGAEVASRLAHQSDPIVYVVSDPRMAEFYAAAISANGREPRIVDSQAAFIAGITAIGKHL